MSFFLLNLILLLFCSFIYLHFRISVHAYCRMSKMSKTYIRKNQKGASNYWLYSQIHKQNDLGVLYYLNLIYLFFLIAFIVVFALSWISFMRIPVMVVGLLLGVATIPVFITSLYYTNIEYFGKAFVVFKVYRGYNGKSRRFSTMFDWLFCIFPLALYVFFLTR